MSNSDLINCNNVLNNASTVEYYNDLNTFSSKIAPVTNTITRESPSCFSDISSNSFNVDHRRYPSSSDDNHSLNCLFASGISTTTPTNNDTMVAIDFPMLSRNSPATASGGYKCSNTFSTLPLMFSNSANVNNSSRRSHEEDIYEDLCYVTLRYVF